MTDEERAKLLHDALCGCDRGHLSWVDWAEEVTDEQAQEEVLAYQRRRGL